MNPAQLFPQQTVPWNGQNFILSRANYNTRIRFAEYLAAKALGLIRRTRAALNDHDFRQSTRAVTDGYLTGEYNFGSEIANLSLLNDDDANKEAIYLTILQHQPDFLRPEFEKMYETVGQDLWTKFLDVNRNPTTTPAPNQPAINQAGQPAAPSTSPPSAGSSSGTPTT